MAPIASTIGGSLPARYPACYDARIAFACTTAAIVLAGCAPQLSERRSPIAAGTLAAARSLDAPAAAWPAADWWRAFGDPQLDVLEAEALAGRPTLREADARARSVSAAAREQAADTGPQLAAEAAASGVRVTRNQGFPDDIKEYLPRGLHSQGRLRLNLSWMLDFFGRNRAAVAAARSEAEAARLDVAAARLFLSTAVASSYAELGRLFRLRRAAEDALAVRRETLALLSRRLAQGLATAPERNQEATYVPVSEGEVAAIARQIAVTRHQIAALLGAGPDRGLAIAPPVADGSYALALPASLPLELVGRRPDLAAARARVEAADERVTVARRDFYPNINLVALAGVQSFGIADLFTRDALAGSAGPAIGLPIFQGGRLRARLSRAVAGYDEAVADYDALLVGAIRDVADVLAAQRAVGVQLDAAQRAESSADAAYAGTRRRYAGGLTSHLEVLTAENGLVARRREVADLTGQRLALDIDLIRVLGGGFVAPDAPNPEGTIHG